MLKIFLPVVLLLVAEVSSHGMMLEPPGRSSRWRFNQTAEINYNDNQLYCGGFGVQWNLNGGKCGVCGDNFAKPHPQENENTGRYGTGVIVKEYQAGQIITTNAMLTANHLGHFEYHLCQITNSNQPESGEGCFKQLKFENGQDKYPIESNMYKVVNRIQLPKGFKCEHCVLRWHYRAGNNVGPCEDGSRQPGCGPQETFRSCADIRIN